MRVTIEEAPRPFDIDDSSLDAYRGAAKGAPVRIAYAATRVVMNPDYAATSHSLDRPGTPDEIEAGVDWDSTRRIRRRLIDADLGIAEAMDTAQRFFIGWQTAKRLIELSGELNPPLGFIAGASVDHRAKIESEAELVDAVLEQAQFIRERGGQVILLPMIWLATSKATEEVYVRVYTEIIRRFEGTLYLHWLGVQFLPILEGYFPGDSFERIMNFDPSKVRGVKLSLLDREFELDVRRRIQPKGQLVLTGDDFNFAPLIYGGSSPTMEDPPPPVESFTSIEGQEVAVGDFSHALLGILDGIAEPASVALSCLASGHRDAYVELMEPCERLGRLIFREPTQHYKGGLAFLSWLNGLQDNFMLVNREEKARSREHYWEVARAASEARALKDAAVAAERLREFSRVWEA